MNIDKSKSLIFRKGRQTGELQFRYDDKSIETVTNFNYLGITLSRTGSFKPAMHKLAEKATKALYEVLKRGRLHNLSIQCHLVLFDKIVQSILLYGCEVWGFSNFAAIERMHLKFCKLLLNLKTINSRFHDIW